MGFTNRALEEQEFLKTKYNELWYHYDDMLGLIIIPETEFKRVKEIRDEIFAIIAEETNFAGKFGRYVLYRSIAPDEKGESVPCYIVCQADIVD